MTTKVDTIFASDSFGNVNVFDLRVGTTLTHYKSNAIPAKCLNVLRDYVVAAEKGPLIYAWPLNSQEKMQTVRMVCPGVVGCCAVSPDESYIAVSTAEKLLIWQLSNGKLLSTTSSHYQAVTVIRWSQVGSDVVTGGEDGLVCVWKLSYLISSDCMSLGIRSNDTITSQTGPRFTFSHHSVRITDVYVGYGGLRARLFTASADKTCRVYDLASGSQLLCVVFDVKPMAIVVDVPEVRLYVGMFDGTIKSFSLLEPPRNLDYHYKESETNVVLSGHTKAITCLTLSIDDTILVSGSADETIRLWHVSSKQLIKTIRMKGVISNLIVRMLPESLQAYELQPTTILKSFQKRYDDSQDSQTLDIVCPIDHYVKRVQEDGAEDEEHVHSLYQKIDELRRINQQLYDFAKDKILDSVENNEAPADVCIENKKVQHEKSSRNNIVVTRPKNKRIKLAKKRSNKS